jgi:UDP-N-acetylmuramate dehydrogenase
MSNPYLELQKRFPGIQLNEPLAPHTYYKIGGPAFAYVLPGSLEEYELIVQAAIQMKVPFVVLGTGANVLIADKGFPGLVIRGGGKQCRRIDEHRIIADAGVPLGALMNETAQIGLQGLEFLAGIPGSVGGAVFGNAGGKDLATGDRVDLVRWIDQAGEVRESTGLECEFAYRTSRFKKSGGTILQATFALEIGDPVLIRTTIEQTLQRKRSVQPLTSASAGCVFTNPPGQSAGRLIDEAGLKGKRIGGAEVSMLHGNFIINADHATAEDVVILISYVKQQVRDRYGIQLQEEIRYIGFE